MGEKKNIIKIIEAVKLHDCIWNSQSEDYAKRLKTENAWKEVAEKVGFTENFCRDKWRNVRTGFFRSIHYKSQSSPDDDNGEINSNRKPYYLYDEMEFLLSSVQPIKQSKKRKTINKNIEEFYASDLELSTSSLHEFPKIEISDDINYNDNYAEKQYDNEKFEDARTTEVYNNSKVVVSTERNEELLMLFFRGSVDDILQLDKRKQRLFKRRMLELIDELHET